MDNWIYICKLQTGKLCPCLHTVIYLVNDHKRQFHETSVTSKLKRQLHCCFCSIPNNFNDTNEDWKYDLKHSSMLLLRCLHAAVALSWKGSTHCSSDGSSCRRVKLYSAGTELHSHYYSVSESELCVCVCVFAIYEHLILCLCLSIAWLCICVFGTTQCVWACLYQCCYDTVYQSRWQQGRMTTR